MEIAERLAAVEQRLAVNGHAATRSHGGVPLSLFCSLVADYGKAMESLGGSERAEAEQACSALDRISRKVAAD